jgi:hypothetical protein
MASEAPVVDPASVREAVSEDLMMDPTTVGKATVVRCGGGRGAGA